MPGLARVPLAVRLERLSVPGPGGCRLWIGNCLPKGYPLVGKGGNGSGNMYAHRAAYELAYGPIPEGHAVHHRCGNRACINPAHLEAVSRAEHDALHAKPTCRQGHAMMADNVYIRPDNGARVCKACRALYMARYHQARNAALGASRGAGIA